MTKKEAALRQITAAIVHFENKEYECAITLASAAERQLSTNKGSKHLFHEVKVRVPPEFENEKHWISWLNRTRDWLKHEMPQWGDEWEVTEAMVAIMIARAITKFTWAYRQGTQRMDSFMKLCRANQFYTRTKH
jgi:hypothetical protein